MIKVHFYKAEATGNDFILIDNRTGEYKIQFNELAKIICDRHKGVGADGLLLAENSEKFDFKMRYFNSDGSEGSMCGNGGRAISKYIANVLNKKALKFEAINNVYFSEIYGDVVRLFMKNPTEYKNYVIEYKNFSFPVWYIHTGAPHAIIFWEHLPFSENNFDNFDILDLSRFIRYHSFFGSQGTNVDIIKIENDILYIRTYEKGVEAETLSCGTGALACSIISYLLKKLSPPVKVIPKSKDIIMVGFNYDNYQITNVFIEGKANILFKGELTYNTDQRKIYFF